MSRLSRLNSEYLVGSMGLNNVNVQPVSGALGAVVSDIDLAENLGDTLAKRYIRRF